jgi:chromosome segregation ATPase
MSILTKFTKVKAQAVGRGIMEMLVQFDPKGMSEAELLDMEAKFNEIGRQVISARNDAGREQAEYVAVAKLNGQRLQAAEALQKQVEALAEGSPDRKSKESSLETLLGLIEAAQPDIAREKQEADEAKAYLTDIETAHKDAVSRLKSAKSDLKRAEQDIKSAKRRQERAENAADAAAVAAGIRQNTSRVSSALDAMKRVAKEADDAAAAAKLKADSLRPAEAEKEDPNIAAAMASVSGAPPAPKSVSERLAALKAKAA